jgi:hypothetical protein
MMTSKDEISLQRHLISAGQWLKKREQGWQQGIDYSKALKIEQYLFASLSVLCDYAEDFLKPNWPTKPFQQKVALIALLQSSEADVFKFGLEKYQELIQEDAAFYTGALWLALPADLSKTQQDLLIESDVLKTLASDQWHQCVWSEQTVRAVMIASDLSAPAWIGETSQVHYKSDQRIQRQLMQQGAAAARELQLFLQQPETSDTHWPLLALLDIPECLDLFFEHCASDPDRLRFAVLNGSGQMLDRLLPLLSTPQFAEQAANAVEHILATPIEWKPSLFDASTGKQIEDGPKLPVAPELNDSHDSVLLMGQVRNLDYYAAWLLNQSCDLQPMGWINLGVLMSSAIPDLSCHWTHVQLQYLQQTMTQNSKVSHAA